MSRTGSDSSDWTGRSLWAEIDLDALAHNVKALKRQAGTAALAAVVKANAYGHGATVVAQAALEAGADRLAVVSADEGEQLRRSGIEAPILVMGHTPLDDAERIVDLRLTPTVNSRELALALAARAETAGLVQPVHLKIDTGLSRYGLPPQEALALAAALRGTTTLTVEGIYTHFAAADDVDKAFTREQYQAFMSTADQLPWIPVRHVSNTAILLDSPEMSRDMVRPGLGIYGLYPSAEGRRDLDLRPVLSLRGRLARLARLSPGDSVSYGRTWRARRASLIGLVMCGYADGLPRLLSNRGSLLVRGKRVPIVGRICMDMCMVDVTDIPGVAEGDEAVIIGSQGDLEISVEELADMCGTISYEILCGMSQRIPRLYFRGGELLKVETLTSPQGLRAAVRAV